MNKTKLMAIVAYAGLAGVVEEIALQYSDEFETTIKVGELPKKLEYGVQAEKDGYDIIISRGGTTELLKHILTIPVVNIEISGYDYMRAIKMATSINGKKAIVGYRKITQNAESVISLMGVDDISVETVKTRDEIRPAIERLVSNGCQLVLGDVVTHRIAKEVGINAMLITSGKESVTSAFNTAKWLMQSFEFSKQKADALDQMLKKNPVASYVMNLSGDLVYESRPLDEIGLGTLDLKPFLDAVKNEGGHTFSLQKPNYIYKISIHPEDETLGGTGYVLHIAYQRTEDPKTTRGVRVERKKGIQGTSELFGYCGIYDKKTIHDAMTFSKVDDPLLILGLPGIGKSRIANCIHRCSNNWDKPFINIDCRLADPANALDELKIDGSGSPVFEGGTVCFGNIQFCSREKQHELFRKIGGRKGNGFRFICTATPRMLENPENYDNSLMGYFSLRLHVSDVEYTEQEMERFVNLNIIEYNGTYGKQIVGMDAKAMETLLGYSWKTDFEGLRQAIGQMVLSAKGLNIEKEDVENVLANRYPKPAADYAGTEGTLDEIELRIMRQVLEEENGNYSKAAERLGIARTTLWRRMTK